MISVCRINSALAALILATSLHHIQGKTCPKLYKKGVIHLNIRPGFLNVNKHECPGDIEQMDSLTISSFFNYNLVLDGRKYVPSSFPPFALDQVGRICNIANVDPNTFQVIDFEKLTNSKTVWPNDSESIPNGILPFEGQLVPQGFLSVRYGQSTYELQSVPKTIDYFDSGESCRAIFWAFVVKKLSTMAKRMASIKNVDALNDTRWPENYQPLL